MLADHVDKGRAAGGGLLLPVLEGFRPFVRFRRSGQISAERYFDHIGKTGLLQGAAPGVRRDVWAELALHCGGNHGIDLTPGQNTVDDVDEEGLGSQGSERTGVDTVAALDALGFIDPAEAGLFIHRDGTHRAGLFAGAHLMYDHLIGAVLCAHTALPAFLRIDMGADLVVIPHDGDSSEAAVFVAGMAETAVAVVRHGIGRDRAVVTGCGDYLHDIGRVILSRALSLSQTYTLPDDLALTVDAAAELGQGPRDDRLRDKFLFAFQFSVPGESCDLTEDAFGDITGGSVVGNHLSSFFVRRYSRRICDRQGHFSDKS